MFELNLMCDCGDGSIHGHARVYIFNSERYVLGEKCKRLLNLGKYIEASVHLRYVSIKRVAEQEKFAKAEKDEVYMAAAAAEMPGVGLEDEDFD